MENGMYAAVSRQLILRRSLDIVANNVANATTTGFKVEELGVAQNPDRRAFHVDGPQRVAFAQDWSLLRDFSQGALEQTGRPLDLAINGDGFFAVERNGVEHYTRDGSFTRDIEGRLVTQNGDLVLSEDGEPIVLDGENATVSDRGELSVNGAPVAQLKVVAFGDNAALERLGEGVFIAPDDAVQRPLDQVTIVQGALEASNVTPIKEITRLIEISRAYQSVDRLINQAEDLRRRATERLGRVT